MPRFPPLAQANAAPMTTTALLNEDPRTARVPSGMPRLPGPKMGLFTEDRREPPATVLPQTVPRFQDAHIPTRQTPLSMPEMARMEPLHQSGYRDVHGSPLLAPQGPAPPPPQPSFMQSQPPPLVSHSRHPSLGKAPGSPVPPPLQRLDHDISPTRRDSVSQRPLYPLPSQPASMSQTAPVLSPPKEFSRPSSTLPEPPEGPPKQVPAKRSNIMSILNDEPEEPPPPKKRYTSEQASTVPSSAVSPSRPVYAGMPPLSQPGSQSRHEEQKTPTYAQQAPSLSSSRSYFDYHQPYQSVSASSGTPSSNDWMARFDPRNQQQQAPPPQSMSSRPASMAPQPPYSPYTSGQSQQAPSLTNLTAPSPVPSPAPGQRPTYQTSVYAQSPSIPSSRELPSQPVYRQSMGSPPPRNSGMAYSSRQGPPTPIQSSASLLNMRQQSTAPYGSTATTPTLSQPGGHQSYQQHVQTMVNGAHQQQAHRSALGLTGSQYGHSTPPPQATTSRSAAGQPPSLSMGRSYTPPAVLHPNPSGGLSYASSGPSPAVGPVHPLHARHSGMSEATPGPPGGSHHHRVYSQGSNAGPLPGPLTPQHQHPR